MSFQPVFFDKLISACVSYPQKNENERVYEPNLGAASAPTHPAKLARSKSAHFHTLTPLIGVVDTQPPI